MDLRLLEYFLRVAELGGINRAATELNLSQPALSRHIAGLEHEMGHQLFTRTSSGVSLTDAGKLLNDRARPLLRQFTQLREQVGEQAAGQVAIGLPQSWQEVFTYSFATAMTEAHSAVTLRVLEGVSHVLRDYLMAGLADLCVLPYEHTAPSGYKQTLLVREPLVFVANRRAGLKAESPIPVTRLANEKLVLPGGSNALRKIVERALARSGLHCRVSVETDAINLCLNLARQGVGSTVVPACALYRQSPTEGICWAPIRGQYLTWSLYENEARSHSPAVRGARSVAIHTVAQSLKQGGWLNAETAGLELKRQSIHD